MIFFVDFIRFIDDKMNLSDVKEFSNQDQGYDVIGSRNNKDAVSKIIVSKLGEGAKIVKKEKAKKH